MFSFRVRSGKAVHRFVLWTEAVTNRPAWLGDETTGNSRSIVRPNDAVATSCNTVVLPGPDPGYLGEENHRANMVINGRIYIPPNLRQT